jgi:hypothetical protein
VSLANLVDSQSARRQRYPEDAAQLAERRNAATGVANNVAPQAAWRSGGPRAAGRAPAPPDAPTRRRVATDSGP